MIKSLQEARQLLIVRRHQREDYFRESETYINNYKNQNNHSDVMAQSNRYEAIICGIDRQIDFMFKGVLNRFRLSEVAADNPFRESIQNAIDDEPSDLWSLTHSIN